MAHSFMFNPEMFVWVDESGCDKRDNVRNYGYALRGVTPVCNRFLVLGERISTVAAMSNQEIVALEMRKGSFNEDDFYDFLREYSFHVRTHFHRQNLFS